MPKLIVIITLAVIGAILLGAGLFNYQAEKTDIIVANGFAAGGKAVSQDPASSFYDGDLYVAYEQSVGGATAISVGKFENGEFVNEDTASSQTDDNQNPFLINWNGTLYLFWDTDDEISTDGKDRDILMRAFDGDKWGNITDISSWDKSEDSEDSWPQAVIYSGEIHIIWESDDVILHRSIESPGKMSQVSEIGQGWGADIDVFGGALYVAWTTQYDSASGDTSVHLRKFENDVWGSNMICVNPTIGNLDYFPSMEGFEGKLHVAWVTKDKSISSGEGDDDIVVRSYDPALGGLTDEDAWSDVVELSDTEEDWDDWPVLCSCSGRLLALWQTWNHETNDGNEGDDLVMRELIDGTWGEPIKVTDSTRQNGDIYEKGFSIVSDDGGPQFFYQSKQSKQEGNDWQIWSASVSEETKQELDLTFVISLVAGAALICGAAVLALKRPK